MQETWKMQISTNMYPLNLQHYLLSIYTVAFSLFRKQTPVWFIMGETFPHLMLLLSGIPQDSINVNCLYWSHLIASPVFLFLFPIPWRQTHLLSQLKAGTQISVSSPSTKHGSTWKSYFFLSFTESSVQKEVSNNTFRLAFKFKRKEKLYIYIKHQSHHFYRWFSFA